MPQVKPCAVCEGPGEGRFFGVFSCRCCAAFFRRSTREARQYVCRATGNCPITENGMRNSCRACRLQRCQQMGMRIGAEETAKGNNRANNLRKSRRGEQLRTQLPSPAAAVEVNSLTQQQPAILANHHHHQTSNDDAGLKAVVPMAECLAKSIGLFIERFQAILAQKFGLGFLLDASSDRPKLTYEDCVAIDRSGAPLFIEMIRQHCPEFSSLQKSQQLEILHSFFVQFGLLLCLEMTAKKAPSSGEVTNLYFYPGCPMGLDSDDFDYFFKDVTGIGKEYEKKTTIEVARRLLDRISKHYIPLAISPLEFAALTGLILWNCLKRMLEARAESQLELLYLELHWLAGQQRNGGNSASDVGSSSSSAAAIVRFGKMLTFLWDFTNMADRDFNEMLLTSKLFLDPNCKLDYAGMWDKFL